MLVARRAAVLVEERGIDERQRRKLSALAALVVVLDLLGTRDAGRAPQRRDGQVVVEVLAVDTLGLQRGEDRRVREAVRVAVRRAREGVVLHPIRRPRVHVLAVRIRRREQRAEEAVVGRERLGGGRDERQVLLAVVADGEHVVLARPQEAVHL